MYGGGIDSVTEDRPGPPDASVGPMDVSPRSPRPIAFPFAWLGSESIAFPFAWLGSESIAFPFAWEGPVLIRDRAGV